MSSLFAALGVAVSGLNAQSQAIGNISDNLANAQTVGYKDIATSFSSLVTASSAKSNSPGGVSATPSYQNDVQGNITSTSSITNMAISGQGFFAVTSATQTATGDTLFTGSTYYTRAGDFSMNKDGYLVNSAGYYLMGYEIDNSIVDTAQAEPIQISALLDNPVPTSTVTYVANLPASASTGYESTASTVQIYDALGNTHQTSLTWSKLGVNTWLVDVNVADGNGATDYRSQAVVAFNSATPAGTIASVTPVTYNLAATVATPTTVTLSGTPYPPQTVSVTVGGADYTYDVNPGDTIDNIGTDIADQITDAGGGTVTASYNAASGTITIVGSTATAASAPAPTGYSTCDAITGTTQAGISFDMNFPGTATQALEINMGTLNAATGVTQYANASSTVSVSSIGQNGLGEGSYSSIGIDSSGIVSINYTNGSTRQIYQIPVAQFNSPTNLQRGTGGVYTATLASGAANLHLAGTNGVGVLSSSSLESSSVDIAGQFTTMIQSQQVYSANAKVVSTVNGMLNTIIQTVQ